MSEVPLYRGTSDKTPVLGSIGRYFLNLRKSRAKPVVFRFLTLRKRTKAVHHLLVKFKETHESGQSLSLNMRPVREDLFG